MTRAGAVVVLRWPYVPQLRGWKWQRASAIFLTDMSKLLSTSGLRIVAAVAPALGGAVYAAVVLLGTGLVPAWEHWYSPDVTFRRQTEAFANWSMSLGDSLESLEWDHAWGPDGDQQVWGLGVPLWRMPFEVIARCCGSRAFPDRIAFGIAIAVASILAYSAVKRGLPPRRGKERLATVLLRIVLVIGLITPAPVVTLYCTWFNVYEEAVAYGCLYAVGLLSLTIIATFSRRRWLCEFTAFAAGIAPLVRPTLVFYAVPTVLAMLILAVAKFRSWRRVTTIAIACACGLAALLATNEMRFGAVSEFGHRLNLNTYDSMRYALRFGAPYSDEPWLSAGAELCGMLFLVDSKSLSANSYRMGVFPGQSDTFRWRELRFTTFDLSNALIAAIAWLWGGTVMLQTLVHRQRRLGASPIVVALACGWWSFTGAVLLFGFYARFPFMSSRYLLDFAPALSAGTTSLAIMIAYRLGRGVRRDWSQLVLILLMATWWCWQVSGAAVNYTMAAARPLSYADVLCRLPHRVRRYIEWPCEYHVGMDESVLDVAFNGCGWNPSTGYVQSAAVFFFPQPGCVRVEVEYGSDAITSQRVKDTLRLRWGLEELEMTSFVSRSTGATILFRPPESLQKRNRCQQLCVAAVPRAELSESAKSEFRLVSIGIEPWPNRPALPSVPKP